MKKAIFLDIDGTIVDWAHGMYDMSDKVKNSLRELQAKGNYIFVATGRPYAFLSKAILDFGFDGFLLVNGAQVIIKDELIYSNHIEKEEVYKLIEEFEREKIQYILQGKKYSYMKESFKEFYDFYDSVGVARDLLKGKYDLDDIDIYKMEMFCLDDKSAKKCLSLISKNPEYSYVSSIDIKAFEIYLKKNTKAVGIMKALEYLGIDVKDSYAFGDGKNDIEMLEIVGTGIAMGNACEEVKRHANVVTKSVKEDGVAVGIEKYIL